MISGSIAALRSSVVPFARTAVSSTCSVAPTLGYGSWMFAPCRPLGADRRMPLGSLSTVAPKARSASRWKSIGRSPIRHPPRSGMKAWPSRCSRGPQKRMGMREAPACASISSMCADTAPRGSSRSTPSPSSVIVTPCTSRRERTTCTSLMSGTSRSTLSVSPRSDATIALVARFFAPLTSTRPRSGRPPRISRTEPPPPEGVDAEALSRVFIDRTSFGVSAMCAEDVSDGAPDGGIVSADGERPRPPRLPARLELRDPVFIAQRQPDVVEPFEEPPSSVIVDVEGDSEGVS